MNIMESKININRAPAPGSLFSTTDASTLSNERFDQTVSDEVKSLKDFSFSKESSVENYKKLSFKQTQEIPVNPTVAMDVLMASKVATNGFFTDATEDVYGFESNIITHNGEDLPDVFRGDIRPDNKTIHIGAVRARVAEDIQNDVIYVNFSGLTPKTLGSDIKFIFKNLLGFETKEMKTSLELVDKVMAKNPNKRVIITGHSMGGALAAYCGIKKQCRVVNFNSMGLSSGLLKKIANNFNQSDIVNINTKNDWLSQCVQRGILKQPGQRYLLDSFSGHGLYYEKSGEPHLLPDALKNIGDSKNDTD